jgi:putative oxidoreductase
MKSSYKRFNAFFEQLSPFAPVFIRLLISFHLVYGTHDKIFSIEVMQGIGSWFQTQGIPFPFFSAYLSAYSQFICGSLFGLGLFARPAAFTMVINFICAIGFAHIGDTYTNTFPALAMLAGSFFLLFNGAGSISIDSFRDDLNKLNQKENWDVRDGF